MSNDAGMELSKVLKMLNDSGDSGQALEGLPEIARKLEKQLMDSSADLEKFKTLLYITEQKCEQLLDQIEAFKNRVSEIYALRGEDELTARLCKSILDKQ